MQQLSKPYHTHVYYVIVNNSNSIHKELHTENTQKLFIYGTIIQPQWPQCTQSLPSHYRAEGGGGGKEGRGQYLGFSQGIENTAGPIAIQEVVDVLLGTILQTFLYLYIYRFSKHTCLIRATSTEPVYVAATFVAKLN